MIAFPTGTIGNAPSDRIAPKAPPRLPADICHSRVTADSSRLFGRTPLSNSSDNGTGNPFGSGLCVVTLFAICLWGLLSPESAGPFAIIQSCHAATVDQPQAEQPAVENAAVENAAAKKPEIEKPDIPANSSSIPANLLTGIRDRTRSIRPEERNAYYSILAHCKQAPASLIVAAATAIRNEQLAAAKKSRKPFSQFLNIIKQPDEHRGVPVTVRGYLRELRTYDAGENPFGLVTLHEGWLYTEDSQGNPWVVVANETTPGIPQPERGAAVNNIVVTGYFFKLWSYSAANGEPWGAPLILANKIEYRPATPTYFQKHQRSILTTLFLAGFLAFIGGIFWIRYRDQQARRSIVAAQSAPVFSADVHEPTEPPSE